MHVAQVDKESTTEGEMRPGVTENILAKNTVIESLVYAKVCEAPRDNTERDKKRPRLGSWVTQQIRGKVKK